MSVENVRIELVNRLKCHIPHNKKRRRKESTENFHRDKEKRGKRQKGKPKETLPFELKVP